MVLKVLARLEMLITIFTQNFVEDLPIVCNVKHLKGHDMSLLMLIFKATFPV